MSMSSSKWNRGRVIGRGSTATVHLASSSSDEPFAVKSADLSSSGFLQHERTIHSFLSPSPYLISYLGFDVTHEPSGTYYNLLLEYAPGGSLSEEIKKNGKLSEIDIKSRTRDVLSGLAHLHSKGIVHCDVKGQNVLIGCDGGAKIADLGCAKFVNDAIIRQRIMGTPMYMAPEVARGEEQGMAADVWAVGCTIVEMAAGGAPWPDASDAVSLLHRIGFTGDTPPVPGWISEEGKDFLGKCLRRDATERWTAEELLRHPFLSDCKWRSPRSTLDRSYWDSLSEVDQGVDKEEESIDLATNAIEGLFNCDVGSPDWTWGNDWMTVRIGGDELMDTTAGTGSEPIVVGTTTSTISNNSIINEEFTLSTSHAETCDLRPVSDNNCRGFVTNDGVKDSVISRDHCNYVIMLWFFNWIFVFVNSCLVASSLLVVSCM